MQFLSMSVVIELHKQLVLKFGGLYGIRDKNLLESALACPPDLYNLAMQTAQSKINEQDIANLLRQKH